MRKSVKLVNQVGVSGAGAKVGGGVGASIRSAPCIIRVISCVCRVRDGVFRVGPVYETVSH